jgi:HD superfamily phosphohydrolase/serine/threonine protein kinase
LPYQILHVRADLATVVLMELPSPILGRYEIVDPAGNPLTEQSTTVDPIQIPKIGSGTFGSVVRTRDRLGLDRAVKLIDPSVLPQEVGATDLYRQEIVLTTADPLKHTIPILDFDTTEDLRHRRVSWYSMPYVSGEHFDKFFAVLLDHHRNGIVESPYTRGLLRDLFLNVTAEALRGLAELHDHNVAHMDISGPNIMVCPPMRPLAPDDLHLLAARSRAFLLDLGAAKRIVPGKTGWTVFLYRPYYFPDGLLNYQDLGLCIPQGLSCQHIRYEKLAAWWRHIDLHCIGRLIEQVVLDRVTRRCPHFTWTDAGAVEAESLKESRWRLVLGDDFDFVERFVDRLLQLRPPVYPDTRAALQMFETLRPTSSLAAYDSVLLTDKYPGLRIRAGAPLVKVAPPLSDVVGHPTFQRLKRLCQLTLISEIFPGAAHSRFTHSLHTFHLMKRYLFGLTRVTDFRLEFGRRDVDNVLTAALVHDVGQYPFSHAIEDLRKLGDAFVAEAEQRGESGPEVDWARKLGTVRHDQELAEAFVELNEPPAGTAGSIRAMLENAGVDVTAVLYMIAKRSKKTDVPRSWNIGRDLVAGIVDADRASYLTYDSEQTGIPYGRAVDVGTLIEGLTVRCDDSHVGLGIEESAVGAAEALLAAVYWMYRDVYWHHTNRAFMAAMKLVFGRLLRYDKLTFEDYARGTFGGTDLDALRLLLRLYDDLLKEGTVVGTNPLSSVERLQRVGYKRLWTLSGPRFHSVAAQTDESIQADQLYRRLVLGITPQREEDLLMAVRDKIRWGVEVNDGDVLVDIPLKPRLRWATQRRDRRFETVSEAGEGSTSLWVRTRRVGTKEPQGWARLQDYSPLAAAFAATEEVSGRKIRVFVSRRVVSRMSATALSNAAELIAHVVAEASQSWAAADGE